jgi:ADP-heptose:LPS heptosyltransferase
MSQPPPGLSPHAPVCSNLPDWKRAERILLIRLRSIGDTVLMTPCLSAIKSWRPDLKITVVSEPLASSLLKEHRLIDRLLISGEGLGARGRLISELRRASYDVAFNLHGGTTATLICALAGARSTVGYKGYRYSALLNLQAPPPDKLLGREVLHSVEQQLALLCWAGVPWPDEVKLSLPVSPAALTSIRARLKLAGIYSGSPAARGYAVLSPSASDRSKMWPRESFAHAAKYLVERYQLRSVVIAGSREESIASDVARLSGNCAVDITGLSLEELVALIADSTVFIGNDSGPMHIAAALGRPLVAIFGGSNPAVWSPWTTAPKRVLIAPGSELDHKSTSGGSQSSSGPNVSRSIERISVDEVTAAVDEVLHAQLVQPGQPVAASH